MQHTEVPRTETTSKPQLWPMPQLQKSQILLTHYPSQGSNVSLCRNPSYYSQILNHCTMARTPHSFVFCFFGFRFFWETVYVLYLVMERSLVYIYKGNLNFFIIFKIALSSIMRFLPFNLWTTFKIMWLGFLRDPTVIPISLLRLHILVPHLATF